MRLSPEDEAQQRLAIDGRVAFAAFGLAMGMSGLILLDRLGLPARLIAVLALVIAALALVILGLALHSSRISSFFSANRRSPAAYVGLAMAGMASGLLLIFLPPLPAGIGGRSLLAGVAGGLALSALISAPLLRKTGALTLAGAIARRFPHPAISLSCALVAALSGLALALAGLGSAGTILASMTGLTTSGALMLSGLMLAILLLPGGAAALLWTSVLGVGLVVASLALPPLILWARGATLPLPYVGDAGAFDQALTRMATLHPDLLGEPTASTIFVVALGLCVLHPLLMAPQTAMRSTDARNGGLMGLVWLALVIALALACLAVSTLALQSATGLRLTDMPDFLLQASQRRDISLCGANPASVAQLREACVSSGGTLRASDLVATPLYLLTASGEVRGLGVSFASLTRAGLFVLALALAGSGVLSFATTLTQDGIERWRKKRSLTSQRLALTRAFVLITLIGCPLLIPLMSFDLRLLVGLALFMGCCMLAPLLLLSLIARATLFEAFICLGLTLFGLLLPILAWSQELTIATYAQIGTFATLFGFCVAALLCLRHPKDPASHGATFVATLLHGADDVMQEDRGT